MNDNYLYLSRWRGVSRQRYSVIGNGNGKFFVLLDGPRSLAAPDDKHHGIGNPFSGMIADPDRHARNSHLAIWGRVARLAIADRVLLISAHDRFFFGTPESRRAQYEIAGPYFPLQ
jgi:hypothetical protein